MNDQIHREHLKRFAEYLTQNKWWEKRFIDFTEDEIKAFLHTAVHITGSWPVDVRRIINWLRENELPQEFQLDQVQKVTNGPKYREGLLADIAAGPQSPHAQYGALQYKLRKIYFLFGPKEDQEEVPF